MSTAHRHDNLVPKGALTLAGALVGGSLLLVVAVRADWLPTSASPIAQRAASKVPVVAERLLRFDDVQGSVRVTDARTGENVATLGQEGSGFIRGVMRGLARERRMHGIDAGPPFRLALYADTQLVLTDLGTGRVIELTGFGSTNRAAFSRLLEPRS